MSEFKNAVAKISAEIVRQHSDKDGKFRRYESGNFFIKESSISVLDVKSEVGMTVRKWIEINYPRIKICTSENGYAA